MSNKSVRPEDILADGVDSAAVNGRIVRKGTMAAFLANAEILEDANVTEAQKQEVFAVMQDLASSLVAIGLHKHVVFKNPRIEQILINAAANQSFIKAAET